VEKIMKYYTFYRENNNFDDILNDQIIKKIIDEKMRWYQYLIIGMNDKHEQTFSYITLKYGDEMKQELVKDFSPIPGIDYVPKRDASLYEKAIE
jgi:hypothetical protein